MQIKGKRTVDAHLVFPSEMSATPRVSPKETVNGRKASRSRPDIRTLFSSASRTNARSELEGSGSFGIVEAVSEAEDAEDLTKEKS